MKKIKLFAALLSFSLLLGFALSPVGSVAALDNPLKGVCSGGDGGAACAKSGDGSGAGGIVSTIIKVLMFIVGALAVIMLIYGGIQYTISSGDSGRVSKAKNTITYSVVGLVLAVVAFALVDWVVKLFIK